MRQHINRTKDKNHITVSIFAEKPFNNIQHPFMIKVLKKLGTEGMYLNIRKTIYSKHVAKIIVNRQKLKPFPLKSV
jgi:hypothetical protein